MLGAIARFWISNVQRHRLRRNLLASFLTDLLIYYRFHGRLPKRNGFLINDIAFWNKAERDAVALGPFTDKELAKYFVAGIAGPDRVPKTLAVLRTVDALRAFDSDAPYIAKPTHASGGVVPKPWGGPLTDDEVATLREWLGRNYFLHGGEHNYRMLEPKILIEEHLSPNAEVPPDYKFTYYRGECLYITIDVGRFGDHRRAYYSPYWRRLDMMWDVPPIDNDTPRPRQLDEVLGTTRKIAKFFEFCRVDCYVFDDCFYVGEITFDPNNAMNHFVPAETEDVRHHLERDARMRETIENQSRYTDDKVSEPARDLVSFFRR